MAGIVTPRAEGVPHPQITPGTPGAVRTVTVSHPQLSRPPEGLYDPAAEHDACGVAFVATLRGTPGRDIVDAALTALANLNHRGAVGAEADSGDGAGILTQVPDAFIRHVVVADPTATLAGIDLERRAFRVRKRVEHEVGVYLASLSCRTLTYKGMLTTKQLEEFFPDLSDPRYATELAVVHSRFSTNTFPSWSLAQPFRLIAHNGEINTVRGNRNWMAARQSTLSSDVLGELAPLMPVCTPGSSDSGSFDEVLELLHLGGRSLPHAVLMMIPEAWENQTALDPDLRAFYAYHSTLIEPWDGPASLTFTDGTLVGAVLDRNGLRPGGTGSPTTAWWCWRARPACWTSTRHASCARAGSSPGGCSWWTPGQDASSMTTRSRRSWPPSGRTPAGSPSTRCGSNSCPNASTSNTPRHPSGVGSGPSGTPRRSSRCSSRRWR